MQEVAIVYFVEAWLACWVIDLLVAVTRGPSVPMDPLLKLIVVSICLVIVTIRLARRGWLWGG